MRRIHSENRRISGSINRLTIKSIHKNSKVLIYRQAAIENQSTTKERSSEVISKIMNLKNIRLATFEFCNVVDSSEEFD